VEAAPGKKQKFQVDEQEEQVIERMKRESIRRLLSRWQLYRQDTQEAL
jgi:hypothetical protein